MKKLTLVEAKGVTVFVYVECDQNGEPSCTAQDIDAALGIPERRYAYMDPALQKRLRSVFSMPRS